MAMFNVEKTITITNTDTHSIILTVDEMKSTQDTIVLGILEKTQMNTQVLIKKSEDSNEYYRERIGLTIIPGESLTLSEIEAEHLLPLFIKQQKNI